MSHPKSTGPFCCSGMPELPGKPLRRKHWPRSCFLPGPRKLRSRKRPLQRRPPQMNSPGKPQAEMLAEGAVPGRHRRCRAWHPPERQRPAREKPTWERGMARRRKLRQWALGPSVPKERPARRAAIRWAYPPGLVERWRPDWQKRLFPGQGIAVWMLCSGYGQVSALQETSACTDDRPGKPASGIAVRRNFRQRGTENRWSEILPYGDSSGRSTQAHSSFL